MCIGQPVIYQFEPHRARQPKIGHPQGRRSQCKHLRAGKILVAGKVYQYVYFIEGDARGNFLAA